MRRRPVLSGRARSARLQAGVAMVVGALVGGAFAFGPTVGAQEVGGEPQPAEVTKEATYVYSLANALPDTVTESFPPQVVCLLFFDACTERGEAITGPIDQQLQQNRPEERVPSEPFVFAPAGSLPAATFAGEERYATALQVELPPVPEGEEVSDFQLVLTEISDFTFHSDSPFFRAAVFEAIQFAGVNRTAEGFQAFVEGFADAVQNVDKFSDRHLGVEACPIIVDWEAGHGQPGTEAPDRDQPVRLETEDGEVTLDPTLDCAFGATGDRQDDGTWVFDLTFAGQGWSDGTLDNHGVFLRPLSAENLAYGDPDPSTFDQVTFQGGDAEEGAPAVVFATAPEPEIVTFDDLGSTGTTGSPEPEVRGSANDSIRETFGTIDAAQAPADARPAASAPPQQQGGAVPAAPAGLTSDPITAWWTWLLLPLALAGGWLVTQALTAEPQLARERSGAMTRLIEARRSATA